MQVYKTFAHVVSNKPKIVAELSKDFGDYYFSLIPKYYYANRQKHSVHVTIVRSFEVVPDNLWKSFSDKIVIYYDPTIIFGIPYFYLNCWSKDIINIRRELGLSKYRFERSSYHITIGNTKTS